LGRQYDTVFFQFICHIAAVTVFFDWIKYCESLHKAASFDDSVKIPDKPVKLNICFPYFRHFAGYSRKYESLH
jgi:hypothetical protein